MSTPREILTGPMAEAALLLPAIPFSPNACIQLLATGLQESGLIYRRQHGNGPAKSVFQLEQGGGVHGVLTHPASRGLAVMLCNKRGVTPSESAAWNAIETDDVLACGFARLLYWTDPRSLPLRDDTEGSWDLYARTWRPGKPKHDTWAANHSAAVAAVINADS